MPLVLEAFAPLLAFTETPLLPRAISNDFSAISIERLVFCNCGLFSSAMFAASFIVIALAVAGIVSIKSVAKNFFILFTRLYFLNFIFI